ncbi:MAG: hypothetical protein R2778_11945 [Saprospiraceae bacterium]
MQYTNPIRGSILHPSDILQFWEEPAANVQIQWPDGKVQTLGKCTSQSAYYLWKFTDAVDERLF